MGCDVLQGYGLTEMSPVTHTARAGDPGLNLASVGPPVPNTEARIVDLTTGAELGANETGEICVRGPQMMKGYLNQPEATAAMIAADAWTHAYTRRQAAYPAASAAGTDPRTKVWPTVARIDNVYGDRNLMCTCPPLSAYEPAVVL